MPIKIDRENPSFKPFLSFQSLEREICGIIGLAEPGETLKKLSRDASITHRLDDHSYRRHLLVSYTKSSPEPEFEVRSWIGTIGAAIKNLIARFPGRKPDLRDAATVSETEARLRALSPQLSQFAEGIAGLRQIRIEASRQERT